MKRNRLLGGEIMVVAGRLFDLLLALSRMLGKNAVDAPLRFLHAFGNGSDRGAITADAVAEQRLVKHQLTAGEHESAARACGKQDRGTVTEGSIQGCGATDGNSFCIPERNACCRVQ